MPPAIDVWGSRGLKIVFTAEGGKRELACKLLKTLVGARGFKPPIPQRRNPEQMQKLDEKTMVSNSKTRKSRPESGNPYPAEAPT